MFRKNIFLLFFVLFFVSCDVFFSKKENIIIKEIPIDYKTIDAYPLLPECKKITDRVLQKNCFYEKLSNKIQLSLTSRLPESTAKIQGNILIKLHISSIGKASIKSVVIANIIKDAMPELDSLIHVSIDQLPILLPAIKAGIPVASEFSLPISININ